MSNDLKHNDYSTSNLAKKLGIPVRELFVLLKAQAWIKRGEDGWLLTNKGEFEGGRYVNSERYGRFIVWPVSFLDHPMIRTLPKELVISASSMGPGILCVWTLY